jgi:hypothetical protein
MSSPQRSSAASLRCWVLPCSTQPTVLASTGCVGWVKRSGTHHSKLDTLVGVARKLPLLGL